MSDLRFDRQYKQIWTTYFKKYKKIYTQNKPKEFEMLREDLKVGLKGLVTSEREGCNMVDEFIKYLPEIRSQEHEWVKLGDNF